MKVKAGAWEYWLTDDTVVVGWIPDDVDMLSTPVLIAKDVRDARAICGVMESLGIKVYESNV